MSLQLATITALIPFAKAKERSREGWKTFASSPERLWFGRKGPFSSLRLGAKEEVSLEKGHQLIFPAKHKKGLPIWKKKSANIVKSGGMTRNKGIISCDPHEPDVGILLRSCGPGSYCMPSDDSEAGGFCTDQDTTTTLLHRKLQNASSEPIFETVCNNATEAEAYNCDCSGFSNNIGRYECQYAENYCRNVSSGVICLDAFYEVIISADGSRNHTLCINTISPFKNEYCYRVLYDGDNYTGCEIEIGCVKCNSCNNTCGAAYGLSFDCSNTVAKTSTNNTCDTSSLGSSALFNAGPLTHNITCDDDKTSSDDDKTSSDDNKTSSTGETSAMVSRILMMGSALLAGGWIWN